MKPIEYCMSLDHIFKCNCWSAALDGVPDLLVDFAAKGMMNKHSKADIVAFIGENWNQCEELCIEKYEKAFPFAVKWLADNGFEIPANMVPPVTEIPEDNSMAKMPEDVKVEFLKVVNSGMIRDICMGYFMLAEIESGHAAKESLWGWSLSDEATPESARRWYNLPTP